MKRVITACIAFCIPALLTACVTEDGGGAGARPITNSTAGNGLVIESVPRTGSGIEIHGIRPAGPTDSLAAAKRSAQISALYEGIARAVGIPQITGDIKRELENNVEAFVEQIDVYDTGIMPDGRFFPEFVFYVDTGRLQNILRPKVSDAITRTHTGDVPHFGVALYLNRPNHVVTQEPQDWNRFHEYINSEFENVMRNIGFDVTGLSTMQHDITKNTKSLTELRAQILKGATARQAEYEYIVLGDLGISAVKYNEYAGLYAAKADSNISIFDMYSLSSPGAGGGISVQGAGSDEGSAIRNALGKLIARVINKAFAENILNHWQRRKERGLQTRLVLCGEGAGKYYPALRQKLTNHPYVSRVLDDVSGGAVIKFKPGIARSRMREMMSDLNNNDTDLRNRELRLRPRVANGIVAYMMGEDACF